MKVTFRVFLLLVALIPSTNVFAIGYLARSCKPAGALEAFTMSYSKRQYMVTRAYLPKIDSSQKRGYKWQRFNSPATLGVWDNTWRSAAGIHPWTPITVFGYFNAVYSYHYWYNMSTHKIERRQVGTTKCNIENWGVNNW